MKKVILACITGCLLIVGLMCSLNIANAEMTMKQGNYYEVDDSTLEGRIKSYEYMAYDYWHLILNDGTVQTEEGTSLYTAIETAKSNIETTFWTYTEDQQNDQIMTFVNTLFITGDLKRIELQDEQFLDNEWDRYYNSGDYYYQTKWDYYKYLPKMSFIQKQQINKALLNTADKILKDVTLHTDYRIIDLYISHGLSFIRYNNNPTENNRIAYNCLKVAKMADPNKNVNTYENVLGILKQMNKTTVNSI